MKHIPPSKIARESKRGKMVFLTWDEIEALAEVHDPEPHDAISTALQKFRKAKEGRYEGDINRQADDASPGLAPEEADPKSRMRVREQAHQDGYRAADHRRQRYAGGDPDATPEEFVVYHTKGQANG
jgi:hypothetical protein